MAVAIGLVPLIAFPLRAVAQPTIKLAPIAGEPGDVIFVNGQGFEPAVWVTVFLDEVHSDNVVAGDLSSRLGAISTGFAIPDDTSSGGHLVIACSGFLAHDSRCLGEQATAKFTVLDPPPPTTTTTGPRLTTTTSSTSTTLPVSTTTTLPIAVPSSTTTSSLVLGAVTTTTSPDPPAPMGPTGVAFTTTSTSIDMPSGLTGGGDDYFPDIEITAVEVTQGIQDLQNRMPLVAGKQTIVRVYIAADKIQNEGLGGLNFDEPEQTIGPEGWEPIDGLLYIQRGAEEAFVYPMNAPITAYRTGSDRLDDDHTLNFVIPDEWLHGELDITALVWSFLPQNIYNKEPDAGNNFAHGTVTFHEAEVPITVWWRLETAFRGALTDTAYGYDLAEATESYMIYHPLDVPNFWPLWTPLGPGEIFGDDPAPEFWNLTDDKGAPLDRMYWLYVTWNAEGLVRFHGLVNGAEPSDGTSGLTSSTMKVAWSKASETTPAHEAAHMYGIKHAPCKDDDEDGQPDEVDGGGWGWIDQTYPAGLPSCSIAPEDPLGYYGTRVTEDNIGWRLNIYSNDQAVDNTRFPFMGYQQPKYVDAYHYCLLMESYEIGCNPSSIGLTPKSAPGPPVNCGPSPSGGIVLDLCLWEGAPDVNQQLGPIGTIQWAVPEDPPDGYLAIEVDTGDGTMGHAMILQQNQSNLDFIRERAKRGGYANNAMLRLTDNAGHIIVQIPVSTQYGAHNDVEDGAKSIELVPWYEEAASVDLLISDEIVATKTPGSAPTVAIDPIEPPVGHDLTITWTGSDPDGDDLLYTLRWSADGGETWMALDTGFKATSAIIDDTFALAGGEVLIEVIASDGLLTGSDISDPISYPKGVPSGVIVAPDRVAQHSPTRMTFQMFDPEDGPILNGNWLSSLDGDLGEGRTKWTRFLSLGTHEISLTVVDSDGNEVTTTRVVEVVESELSPPRVEGDVPLAEAIVRAGPGALDQFAGENDHAGGQTSPSQTLVIVMGVVVIIAAMGLAVRRRRTA